MGYNYYRRRTGRTDCGFIRCPGGTADDAFGTGDAGGQAALTDWIDNYPGHPQGVSGSDLMTSFMEQASRFGMEYKGEEVTGVDFAAQPKVVTTTEGQYLAKSVIIATGARPRLLGVPGEKEFTGRGVSYCATCDGAFFKEKKLFVVGGGDAAIDEAVFLTRYAREVIIVHRRNQLRAAKAVQERALTNPKIRIIFDSVVEEIKGLRFVEQVVIKNLKTGVSAAESADGVFIYVGTSPNTAFLQDAVKLNAGGYAVSGEHLVTSQPGVFVVGDVRTKFLRQVSTAVGDGAEAAMAAEHYITELGE